MTIFTPVREARRVFEQRYAEQLPLYTDDLCPPLLVEGPSPERAAASPSPRAGLRRAIENTNASCPHDSGRVARGQEAEGV